MDIFDIKKLRTLALLFTAFAMQSTPVQAQQPKPDWFPKLVEKLKEGWEEKAARDKALRITCHGELAMNEWHITTILGENHPLVERVFSYDIKACAPLREVLLSKYKETAGAAVADIFAACPSLSEPQREKLYQLEMAFYQGRKEEKAAAVTGLPSKQPEIAHYRIQDRASILKNNREQCKTGIAVLNRL